MRTAIILICLIAFNSSVFSQGDPGVCLRVLLTESHGLNELLLPGTTLPIEFNHSPSGNFEPNDFPVRDLHLAMGQGFAAVYDSLGVEQSLTMIELPSSDDLFLAAAWPLGAPGKFLAVPPSPRPIKTCRIAVKSIVRSAVFGPGDALYVLTDRGLQIFYRPDLSLPEKWEPVFAQPQFLSGMLPPDFKTLTVIAKQPELKSALVTGVYVIIGAGGVAAAFLFDENYQFIQIGKHEAPSSPEIKPTQSVLVSREFNSVRVATAHGNGQVCLMELNDTSFRQVGWATFGSAATPLLAINAGPLPIENDKKSRSAILISHGKEIKLVIVEGDKLYVMPNYNRLTLPETPTAMVPAYLPAEAPVWRERRVYTIVLYENGYQVVWVRYHNSTFQYVPVGRPGIHFDSIIGTPTLEKN